VEGSGELPVPLDRVPRIVNDSDGMVRMVFSEAGHFVGKVFPPRCCRRRHPPIRILVDDLRWVRVGYSRIQPVLPLV